MRIDKLMVVLVVVGSAAVGFAEDKAKPAANSSEPATEATAESKAETAPPAQRVEPAAVVRRVDPVEAALAQAMAHSQPPTAQPAAKPTSSKGKPADRGLQGLNKFARTASKININAWTHSTRVPVHEPVVRMDVQSLSALQVATVIKNNLRKIQYCHERLAGRGGAPSGEVAVRFVVHPKGHAVDIKVTAGGVNARALERCMVARIRGLKFPAADAPTEVSYPFVFDTVGSAVQPGAAE